MPTDWKKLWKQYNKRIAIILGSICAALILILVVVNAEKINEGFDPEQYADDEDGAKTAMEYDSFAFGSKQDDKDGLELDDQAEEDYDLDDGDQNILDEEPDENQQSLLITGGGGTANGNGNENAAAAVNDGTGPAINGNSGGTSGNAGGLGTGTNNGTGNNGGSGNSGGTGNNGGSGNSGGGGEEPAPTPEPTPDPEDQKYGTDYNNPESVESFQPGSDVTVTSIEVTKGSLKQHFFQGEALRIEEMSSYITVTAHMRNSRTNQVVNHVLKYRANDETGGDYTVSWENNAGNTSKNDIGYPTVGNETGTYTATISYKGYEIKEQYDIVHWQITLNDFEDDYADGQDTFTAKYETFPKTESPVGTPIINIKNNMQAMYNLVGARTLSAKIEDGFEYHHLNVQRQDITSEYDPYYVEYFGGWTQSKDMEDAEGVGNYYEMKRPTDSQVKDGVYNVDLYPTWEELTGEEEYTVALTGAVDEVWTSELIGYSGDSDTILIPQGVTNFNMVDFNGFAEDIHGVGNGQNSRIKKIVFPSSLDIYENSVLPDDFVVCFPNLEEIEVPVDNPNFLSIDGVLYDKTGKLLLSVPCGKKTIDKWSKTVNQINQSAFQYVDMENLTLADTINVCGNYSFYNATIDYLTIPCTNELTLGCSTFDSGMFIDWDTFLIVVKPVGFQSIEIKASEIHWAKGSTSGGLFNNLRLYAGDDGWKNVQFVVPDTEEDENYRAVFSGLQYGIDADITGDVTYSMLSTESGAEENYHYQDGFLLSKDNKKLGCASIYMGEAVTVPDGVEIIETAAFRNCEKITSVNLPLSVRKVNEQVFSKTDSLAALYFNGETPVTFGNRVFGNVISNGMRAYVPESAYKEYVAENEDVLEKNYGKNTAQDLFLAADMAKMVIVDGSAYYTSDGGETFRLFKAKRSIKGMFSPIEGTVELMDGCFENCSQLSCVVLPDSVQKIGAKVFENCSSLQQIASNAVAAPEVEKDTFIGLDIKGVELFIPSVTGSKESYQTVEWKKFSSMRAEGTTYIVETEAGISQGLYGVQDTGYKLIQGKMAVAGTFSLKNGTIIIGEEAFAGDTLVEDVANMNEVTEIGRMAFKDCTALKGSFDGTTWMETFAIPDGVSRIPDSCFEGCTALGGVKIPRATTSLGEKAFKNCSMMLAVYSQSNSSDDYYTFVLPYNVSEIPAECFAGCTLMAQVWFPESVQTLGESAFEGCESISQLLAQVPGIETDFNENVLPANVTVIPKNCFAGCSGLTAVEFPKGLERVDTMAFADCGNINSVCINSKIDLSEFAAGKNIETLEIGADFEYDELHTDELQPFSSASQIKVHGHIKRLSGSFAGWKNLYSFSSFGSSGSGASMGSSATIDTLGAGLFEGCLTLQYVDISDVMTIESRCFADSTGLLLVSLDGPYQIEVPDDCFAGSSQLLLIMINDQLMNIAETSLEFDSLEDYSSEDSVEEPAKDDDDMSESKPAATEQQDTQTEIEVPESTPESVQDKNSESIQKDMPETSIDEEYMQENLK